MRECLPQKTRPSISWLLWDRTINTVTQNGFDEVRAHDTAFDSSANDHQVGKKLNKMFYLAKTQLPESGKLRLPPSFRWERERKKRVQRRSFFWIQSSCSQARFCVGTETETGAETRRRCEIRSDYKLFGWAPPVDADADAWRTLSLKKEEDEMFEKSKFTPVQWDAFTDDRYDCE